MQYLIRRLGQAALVLVLAYTVAFVLLAALPGDGVLARYGDPELGLSPEQLDAIRAAYGADRPVAVRLLDSAWAMLRGDFGYSIHSGAAVGELLAANLPATLTLAAAGLGVAAALAVTIALTATYGPFPWLRRLIGELPPLLVSVPVFWAGIMLVQIASFQLRIVPTIGATPLQALVLPVCTLAIPIAAPLAQVLIRSIEEVRAQPFVAVARARGAGTAWLLRRHVLPNAVLPTLTIAGLLFGELVGGAVVTESVFARNGIGQLTAQAVANRDTPVLLAVVVISTVAFVGVNLVVDLLTPLLDARLRVRSHPPVRSGADRAADAAGGGGLPRPGVGALPDGATRADTAADAAGAGGAPYPVPVASSGGAPGAGGAPEVGDRPGNAPEPDVLPAPGAPSGAPSGAPPGFGPGPGAPTGIVPASGLAIAAPALAASGLAASAAIEQELRA